MYGNTIKHDWIEVPESWDDAKSPKIKVFYYYRKDTDSSFKDPVVFFNGGPAGSSHSSYSVLQGAASQHNLSFVYLDQRGTGCSDGYPVEVTATGMKRLQQYASRSIVRDAEAIRVKLLGEKQRWHSFGQSYGGYITHRYVEEAPQGLTGAFAHGSSLMADTIEWITLRLLSQKRIVEEYFAKYPGDRDIITKARSQISDKKCFTDEESTICGSGVLDAAVILLAFRNSWPTLHSNLSRILDSNGRINEAFLERWVSQLVFGVFANNAMPASAIWETENGIDPFDATDISYCHRVTQRLVERGEKPDTWDLNECRVLGGLKSPFDRLIGAIEKRDTFNLQNVEQSLSKHAELPFHLYAGEMDPVVPIETFTEEVKQLGERIRFTQFPTSGHEGFYTEKQVWKDLVDGHK